MSETQLGIETVTLGAHSYQLKPTLAAVVRLEARFGGLRPVLEALRALSVSACAEVIAAGADVKDSEAVAEQVFQAGVVSVAPLLVRYVTVLLNPTPPSTLKKPEAASTAAP